MRSVSSAPAGPIWRHPNFAIGAREMSGIALGIAASAPIGVVWAPGPAPEQVPHFCRRATLVTFVSGMAVLLLRLDLGW